ncbi:nucleotidyltransferase [Candidatus Woesearchaeota archaeon CG10_big_fil_rev_8_21_14_0_10_47_5]|nr:MAG: nucleotidyltransferase [Candidatus Woesearchaeota archaeon CG10_big_fil_rev_8_21_14_0_10_47_5]HII30302.1 nucleotidyltransferase domain-containing protein [Candidatus Woesearchaeota archaeon]
MAEIKAFDVDKWIKDFKKRLYEKYKPEKIIIFGSRARKDNLIESDIDFVIVSKMFEGMKWPRRLAAVSELWKGLIAIEPLCYTPKEFDIKKRQLGIVNRAVDEGVEI